VFTDEDNVIDEIAYLPPLGKSDHACVDMKYIREQQECDVTQATYDFWKGDYSKIKEELRKMDWEKLLSDKSTDEAWTYFHSRMSLLLESYVPLVDMIQSTTGPLKKVQKHKKKNEWITKTTVAEIKKKNAAWAEYRKFGSERNYKAYKAVRNQVTKLIRNDKVKYQRQLAVGFQKRFYGYMRQVQTIKDKVMGLKKANGQQTVTNQETADVFCEYFNEVLAKEGSRIDDITKYQTEDLGVEITEVKVKKLLCALKTDKSPGPDGMHCLLFHSTADEVAKLLTLIFNKSYIQGELPHD